jgi:hypothetical protein
MKIEEVKGYRYGDKLYDSPAAAINAGLLEIANDLQRNHVNAILPGLRQHRDALLYLLGQEAFIEASRPTAAPMDPSSDD